MVSDEHAAFNARLAATRAALDADADARLARKCEAVLMAPLVEETPSLTAYDIAKVIARHGGTATHDELRKLAGLREGRFTHLVIEVKRGRIATAVVA